MDNYLQVGTNEKNEVVVNLDKDRTGHLIFSPKQAIDFATILLHQAAQALLPISKRMSVSELLDADKKRLDFLDDFVQSGHQSGHMESSFEIDGGIHATFSRIGDRVNQELALRECNTFRDAVDKAILAYTETGVQQ